MWDSRWQWLAGTGLLLAAAALISIWRGQRHSRQAKVVWTVVAVLLPILGPLGWFLLARETRKD
jgi:heme A synthase